ncbi:MAG: tandem-95 repeat protein [Gammaproteobacteria bacterium]|nr:tandem-95 repeat protein [Gammaproteobacteria bacterium]
MILGVLANDSDLDGDSLAPLVVDGPLHGTLTPNADGTLTYTPNANYFGDDAFTYVASDGALESGLAAVSLSIRSVNDLPVGGADVFITNEDTPVGGNVLANDTDVEDGRPGTVSAVNGAAGNVGATIMLVSGALLAVNADGSFSYDPNGKFEYLGFNEIALDGFTYVAQDSEGAYSGATDAQITIFGVNDAPKAVGDAFTTDEDVAVSGSVLGNDEDAESDPLSTALVLGPQHGLLVFNDNGAFTYTPGTNFNGSDSFTYRSNDGALESSVATVSLTINPVNDAPASFNDLFTSDEDVEVSGNVLGNDIDVDGDALTATKLTDPANGALVFNSDGSFTYTPDANWFGVDTFTYQASDGEFATQVATVTLQIASVNDAPVAKDDVIPASGGGAVRVAVVGGSASTYLDAAAQLDDSPAIVATAILVTAFTTLAQWQTALAAYDVVVVGENGGTGSDYDGTQIFAALRQFVDLGGGVVTTGVFAGKIAAYGEETADADYISPAGSSSAASAFAPAGGTISVPASAHPIVAGITNYVLVGPHEVAALVDSTATVLATDGADRAAIAYDVVGAGRTVFLGAVHMATAGSPFFSELTRSATNSTLDQIFEQAVVWSAGDLGSGATTDEDTIYVIDDALLLANDTDIEDDVLSILSVSATSALGAAVSINATGDVVYDPTVGLQYLPAGQIETDSFEYTVSDGHGGFDTAKVTLTVAGKNDAPHAVNDARNTNEDTTIVGNVLANDTDAEGDALTVTTAGSFNTARGAAVTLGADGSFSYNPTVSAALQALAAGTSVVDSFNYSISDGKGGTDTASVNITVAGLNEPGSGGSSGSGKLLDSVPSGADLDYYIRFDDVSGGEWLRLEGFSMGLSNSGSATAGGGAGAGMVTASDVSSLLGSSRALVELTAALAAGQHLKGVEIEAYVPGLKSGLVDQYYFEDVLVSSLQTSGNAFSTANSLSFDFAKFNHGHVEFDANTGAVKSTSEAGFDFANNVSFTGGPSVAGDALKAKQDLEALPTDVQLQYYVTFDGAPGWLELDSFSMGLSQSGGLVVGGGGGAGKVSASEVVLALGSSRQILDLTDGVTMGQHFKFLEVEAYQSGGGKPQLVDQYYFEDVLVTGLSTVNATSNQVSLDYAKFSHGHLEYSGTGTSLGSSSAGWDLLSNTAFTGPPVAADVDLF